MFFVEEVKAVQAELSTLLELQGKDQVVRATQETLASLKPELDELDAELEKVSQKLIAARQAAKEVDDKRAELESRIESYRVMQERRRQRLEWVRGAKEASAIMAELDLARGVLAKEEAEWIRTADKVQEAEKVVAEIETELEATEVAQAPTREACAAKAAEYETEIEAAEKKRARAAKAIQPRLLEVYERVLRGRAPNALYPLRGGACGYCFTAVPLHRRQQIQNGKTLEHCEACGVLVYNDPEA